MTNAIDGLASAWSEGAIRILQAFADHGPPSARTRRWDGRWWSLWSTVDLVAFRDHVKVASPGLTNPFQDAEEIEITGRDVGRIRQAAGFSSHGESVELVRARSGKISAVQLAGLRMVPESRYKAELQRRYEGPKP
jgi:D-alanyl-D-alanine carboxypeptidase